MTAKQTATATTHVAPANLSRANLKKIHAVLHNAGFTGHAIQSLTLQPLATMNPSGHMECNKQADGSVICGMV